MPRPLLVILVFISLIPVVINAQAFPAYTISICSPESKGYYFCSLLKSDKTSPSFCQCHVIFDNKGAIVYYKFFPAGQFTGDFKLQPNGIISYFFNDKFYLMDSTFTIVDSVFCKNGLLKDSHELQILPNGHFLLLGNEIVQMDLTTFNYFNKNNSPGSARAIVKYGVIQEQDRNKNVVFEWHSKNYLNFNDVDPYFLSDTLNVDPMHFNAIDCDEDYNYLLSVRYFNEIIKIKRSDSTITWRLGGKNNQFTFVNDSQKFFGQHDIRRIKNGHLTLFDNGREGLSFHPATAKEYQIDEKELQVRLTWSYTDNKKAISKYSGSVQRLPDGKTLINYGTSTQSKTLFNVVKPSGSKIFEIIFKDTIGSYRSFNYANLPWKLRRPEIKTYWLNEQFYLDAGNGYSSYLWSNGATTQTIVILKPGTYSVFVSTGKDGFISSPSYYVKNISKHSKIQGSE